MVVFRSMFVGLEALALMEGGVWRISDQRVAGRRLGSQLPDHYAIWTQRFSLKIIVKSEDMFPKVEMTPALKTYVKQ